MNDGTAGRATGNDGTAGRGAVLARGAIGGLLAWLVGYLVVYAAYGSRIENWIGTDVLAFLTGEGVTWKLVGWLFYNVHLVSVRIPGLFGGTTRNFATGADDPGVVAALALPPLLLGLAGLAAAWRTSGDRSVSARNGAAVALGYLPPSVAGAFLFELSAGDATAGPVVLTAVLVAGLAYPLVLGAVGGGLGPVLADALTGD